MEINAPRGCGPDGHFLAQPNYLRCQCGRAPDRVVPAGQRPEPAASRPPLDELKFIDGEPIVHANFDSPCSRCETVILHTLDQCGQWTRQVMAGQPLAGQPRAATRIVNDPSPRDPEPAPDVTEQRLTLNVEPLITRTYWCPNTACEVHDQRITVQLQRVGHFVDLPRLRCRFCGCEALDWMAQPTSTSGF